MNDVPETQAGRCFPRITENFYSAIPALAATGGKARTADIFRPRRADPAARFSRIASLHRSAYEAEIAGFWTRADFYWKELWETVLAHSENDKCWEAGAAIFPAAKLSGSEFRHRFLREVVLDSHAGFFLGQVVAGIRPDGRPRFHLEALSDLLRRSPSVTPEEEKLMVDPLVLAVARNQGEEQPGDESIGFWIDLAERFPRQQHYLNPALAAIHANSIRKLQSATPSGKMEIAKVAIGQVEKLRSFAPSNPDCFRLLCLLYHEQALCQANARLLEQSFLSLRKAEIYGGPNPQVAETRVQLDEVLSAIRQRALRIGEALEKQPGATLTAEGRKFVAEAQTALRAANNWESSEEAKNVRKDRESAVAVPAVPFSESNPEISPLIRPQATTGKGGEESLVDWLVSSQGRRVRWQIRAAATTALIALMLLAREGWADYSRSRAWQRAETAISSGNDTAALDAMADYFSLPAPLRREARVEAPLVRTYTQTMGRWFASRSADTKASLSEEDLRRVRRYKSEIVDKSLDRNTEAEQ